MKTNLPPLNTLIFFEASARLGSFTRAAEELCVTQSAVSKQVKSLEESLGFELFRRERRRLVLNDAGKEFYSEVSIALSSLTGSINKIKRYYDSNAVTITCTPSVAHYWLFPRIPRFNMAHPNIPINVYATNDITASSCKNFDLGILNGDGLWDGQLISSLLFVERIYPVCTYDYPTQKICTPEELLDQKLIHLDPAVWQWPTWIDWFESFGISYDIPKDAQLFNQVNLVLEATSAGMGIGLGWEFTTESLIKNKVIRRISDLCYEPNLADYLVYRKDHEISPSAAVFRDWIMEDITPD